MLSDSQESMHKILALGCNSVLLAGSKLLYNCDPFPQVLIFYFLRCLLAFLSCVCELYFYK